VVLLLVISHWVLDFVSHRADLLWPGNSPLLGLGLGLWNSVAATLVVEGAMFAAALTVYLRSMTAVDLIGSVGFWLLIVFSTLMWASQPWSSPPLSPWILPWFGLGTWLFPLWAGWADRHRLAGIT
jgi:hypothetical protein